MELPADWVCVPECVCWDLQALRPVVDVCPLAQALRPQVHAACTYWYSVVAWSDLFAGAQAARQAGLSARLLAAVLSEPHWSPQWGARWKTALWALHRPWSGSTSIQSLLGHGACPTLGGVSVLGGDPCARWQNVGSVFQGNDNGALLDLAGGIRDRGQVPPGWRRWHGRLHKRAWLTTVTRVVCTRQLTRRHTHTIQARTP